MGEFPNIPGFTCDGVLGRGGMAVVYSAIDLALGRRVAIKVVSPGDNDEAQHVRRLEHSAEVAVQMHFSAQSNRTNAIRKLTAQMNEATQPGPVTPNNPFAPTAKAGPTMNPNPNAIPIKPIRFDRSAGGVMSAI